MNIKAYFVTSGSCHYCDVALDALKAVHGEEAWKPAMELVPTSHPVAKANKVLSTPTLLVIDTSQDDKLVARVAGADNLNEDFWGKFFTFVPASSTPVPPELVEEVEKVDEEVTAEA